jgi:hypothetical protein
VGPATVAALTAFLGMSDASPARILAGGSTSSVSMGTSPGEIRAGAVAVARTDFARASLRLADPRAQPGVITGGFVDAASPDSVAAFVREVRLDDGDVERLRACARGHCRLKLTERAAAALSGLRGATNDERRDAYLRSVASLAACAFGERREFLVESARPIDLAQISRRLAAEPSFEGLLEAASPVGAARCEWRVESYWKRKVTTLSRVELVEGRLHGRRALLQRRSSIFSTHYIDGSRVEVLIVDGDSGILVAQRHTVQTDKASGFNAFERALIRSLGGRRLESQAREWRSR